MRRSILTLATVIAAIAVWVAPITARAAGANTWAPATNSTWQWVLASPPTTLPAGISWVDVDGFDNTAAQIAAWHAQGLHAVCYIDVGTWENWRPDASLFPRQLKGRNNGWPGEKWLNTSPAGPYYATLQRLMTARFKMCAAKGFDAVEPDNMDGSENTTGFRITNAHQIAYDEWVAAEVHSLGMSVAQKNFNDQSSALVSHFDFVINEQCYQYHECVNLQPYVNAHKAVFDVEYRTPCPTKQLVPGVNVMLRNLNLTQNGRRVVCPTPL